MTPRRVSVSLPFTVVTVPLSPTTALSLRSAIVVTGLSLGFGLAITERTTYDGVAFVRLSGDRLPAMRIWIDPDKAAARGLTAGDILRAVGQSVCPRLVGRLL